MITLSNYLEILFATIAAIGAQSGSEATYQPERFHGSPRQQFAVRSVEFNIPFAIQDITCAVQARRSRSIGSWLEKQTNDVIMRLLKIKEVSGNSHDRLQKTIAECSKKVQALLEQEEVAIEQVFLDYSQAVLATVWDEYQQEMQEAPLEGTASHASDDRFEQLTQELVAHLRDHHAGKHGFHPFETVEVTVETQKLTEFPAHLLTYIKLLITGVGPQDYAMEYGDA